MENMNPESLLRKAQALGEDIKEMESIDVMGAYQQAQTQIKTNRRRSMYNQLMRYAAFLTIPLLLSSLILGYLYWEQRILKRSMQKSWRLQVQSFVTNFLTIRLSG